MTRLINADEIPKFVTELHLLNVIHNDGGNDSSFEISLRQIEQQVLPEGLYPKSILYAYGNPNNKDSFRHPAPTVEVTQGKVTTIVWRNELVKDPEKCFWEGEKEKGVVCNYLPHVLQDSYGIPIIDQNLHWAAPHQKCKNGEVRTDCQTGTNEPYFGPIPMSVHVHGAHTESQDDGYPEGWFLPKSNNIPEGYATTGSYFRSRFLPTKEEENYLNNNNNKNHSLHNAAVAATDSARGKGYAIFRYTNDQRTTSLWYHDHALGITRLNVYAASGGFWFIRDSGGLENFLAKTDVNGREQRLPGPPPPTQLDLNTSPELGGKVREIGLIIQDMSFYQNGKLFYPASRLHADYPQCSSLEEGRRTNVFAENHEKIPFSPNSDILPAWSPEAFFDTMVVNGNTWPKLDVAPERYRFRILNACDSRVLNLALMIDDDDGGSGHELPFFVIGSDQGLLPRVVLVRTGYARKLDPAAGENPLLNNEDATSKNEFYNNNKSSSNIQSLLVTPAERYDVIVDFSNLSHGTKITLVNTGPDAPFQTFSSPEYEPANYGTTGQIMQFVIDESLHNPNGDPSTPPHDLILESQPPKLGKPDVIRDLALKENVSKFCVAQQEDLSSSSTNNNNNNNSSYCGIQLKECDASEGEVDPDTYGNSLSFGSIGSFLGYNGSKGAMNVSIKRWMDRPIEIRPVVNSIEEWELWNWTPDAHPIHIHSGSFEIIGRYDIHSPSKIISGPLPWEEGHKDTVAVPPKTITKIRMKFTIPGLFVWHCHVLSHEDNEMMLPFCVVGDNDGDTPLEGGVMDYCS